MQSSLFFCCSWLAFLLQSVAAQELRVSDNRRFLVTADGKPFFLVCETAWQLAINVEHDSAELYLDTRKAQQFNAVTLQAFPSGNRPNIFGDFPFVQVAGKFDPVQPLITRNSNPAHAEEYDYWDNLDYIVNLCAKKGFYTILLPTWGSRVVGTGKGKNTESIIFNPENAYRYGNWLGKRYRSKKHIIWMLGDVSAVYSDSLDFRPVFRAMAEGIADGVNGEDNQNGQADYGTTLMSYHPEKLAPQSSAWFHGDAWLDFNSVQDWPENQLNHITHDYGLLPVKPTWLFEGRYEKYHRFNNKPEDWGAWQIRFQAYQTVFAGGLGHTHGHEYVFGFGGNWYKQLKDPGAATVQHLVTLMKTLSDKEYLTRVPAQEILDGHTGEAGRQTSSWQQATKGADGTYAFVYAANGSTIRIKMNLLKSGGMNAFWFNPRTGQWWLDGQEYKQPKPFRTGIQSGAGVTAMNFDPPGTPQNENDWVLVLRAQRID